MAILNYQRRLQNLNQRRFDANLQKSIMSESYSTTHLPEYLKYLAESMKSIPNDYNRNTITAAENVKNHLEKGLHFKLGRDYRTQGSVMTGTNIKTHSDIDLLTIISNYSYYHRALHENERYKGDAKSDIEQLKLNCVEILRSIYDEVDDTGEKAITIYNKNLRRKVDIVICYWYVSEPFEQNNDEYYKGVWLYNFKKRERARIDYPFAHIRNVNYKGSLTNDGSRKSVRLLKTLRADSEPEIDLSSFELTSIVHSIDNKKLYYLPGSELEIAEQLSSHINNIIINSDFRKSIQSPTGIEYPLRNDSIVSKLSLLKKDLDALIADCKSDLKNGYFEKAIKNY